MAIILYEYAGGDRPEENKLSTVDPPNVELHPNAPLHLRVFSWGFVKNQPSGDAPAGLRARIASWERLLRPNTDERIEK
jgi:hypothetical protein